MLVLLGQRHLELGALTRCAHEADRAVMFGNDGPGNGQPLSRTLADVLCGEERFEYPVLHVERVVQAIEMVREGGGQPFRFDLPGTTLANTRIPELGCDGQSPTDRSRHTASAWRRAGPS